MPGSAESPPRPPLGRRGRRWWLLLALMVALVPTVVVAGLTLAGRARGGGAEVALVGAVARGATATSIDRVELGGAGNTVTLTATTSPLARAPDEADLGVQHVPAGRYQEVRVGVGSTTLRAALRLQLHDGDLVPLLVVVDGGRLSAYTGSGAVSLGLQLAGGTVVHPPDAITLADQNGVTASLQQLLRGHLTVLVSFNTHCHDTCPLYTALLADLEQTLRARGWQDRVQLLEVTMDPGRDSPAVLSAYARLTGADWRLLTGDPAAVRLFWNALGVRYQESAYPPQAAPIDWYSGTPEAYHLDHDSAVFVVDGDGNSDFALLGNPRLSHGLSQPLDHLLQLGGHSAAPYEALATWTITDLLDRVDVVLHEPAEQARATEATVAPGTAVPDFTLRDLDGQQVRLAQLVGAPVIVNFWATWCGPCRAELPRLAASVREHPRLRVLAVDEAEDAASVRSYLRSLTGTSSLTVLLDGDRAVAERYALAGMPVSVMVDAGGTVRAVHVGELSSGDLRQALTAIGAA